MLPEGERDSLAAWLNELDYDSWDREMAADFPPGGRGMALVEKVKREIAGGKALPFEEALKQVRAKRNRHPRRALYTRLSSPSDSTMKTTRRCPALRGQAV